MIKSFSGLVTIALGFVCTMGLGTARAANITATEAANDIASLAGTQFDVAAFTSTNGLEAADGTGRFQANATSTGQALVVLTEGIGGANSDWFQIIFSGPGGFGTELVTVHWRSDADPGGLPALPVGVVPMFVAETGASQDITGLLVASAVASGFVFPSNLTVQVQSDLDPAAAVPEPATLTLTGLGLAGLVARFRRRRVSSVS